MTAGSASAKTRKIAAALAAVQLYLEEEQAAAVAVAAAPAPTRPGMSPWSLSGRFAAIGSRMGSRGSWHSR